MLNFRAFHEFETERFEELNHARGGIPVMTESQLNSYVSRVDKGEDGCNGTVVCLFGICFLVRFCFFSHSTHCTLRSTHSTQLDLSYAHLGHAIGRRKLQEILADKLGVEARQRITCVHVGGFLHMGSHKWKHGVLKAIDITTLTDAFPNLQILIADR